MMIFLWSYILKDLLNYEVLLINLITTVFNNKVVLNHKTESRKIKTDNTEFWNNKMEFSGGKKKTLFIFTELYYCQIFYKLLNCYNFINSIDYKCILDFGWLQLNPEILY